MRQWTVCLEGRKVQGTPYGGTWQVRRGLWRYRGWVGLWKCWREERGGRFDRFRLTVGTVGADYIYTRRWPR